MLATMVVQFRYTKCSLGRSGAIYFIRQDALAESSCAGSHTESQPQVDITFSSHEADDRGVRSLFFPFRSLCRVSGYLRADASSAVAS